MFREQLRQSARVLAKAPGFAVAAVVCLSLGIAVNATVFSLFESLILNPYVYPNPDTLVQVVPAYRGNQIASGLSGPEYVEVARTAAFERAGAYDLGNVNLTGIETPERLVVAYVTEHLFAAYGLPPSQGRTFTASEMATDTRVIVVSHRLWVRQFGAETKLAGQTIGLNGVQHTIVGVLPPRFMLGAPGIGGADIYRPFWGDLSNMPRGHRELAVVARLRNEANASAELEAIARRMERDHGSAHPEYKGWTLRAELLSRAGASTARMGMIVLLAAVAAILLIACVNVANLMLARAAMRQREIAIRRALGATRAHLLSQFTAEGLIVCALAGVLGVMAAYWLLDLVLSILPRHIEALPPGVEIAVRWPVLVAVAGMVLLSSLFFGVVPVFGREQTAVNSGLQQGARHTGSARSRRISATFVVVQVALSCILLVATGLAVRSYQTIMRADLGFRPDRVMVMRMTLPRNKYKGPQVTRFFEQVEQRAAAIPGIRSAGLANAFPPLGFASAPFVREGQSQADQVQGELTVAGSGYFATLGVPLLSGRIYGPTDDAQGAPPVVLINEAMARRLFPNEDPIGKRIRVANGEPRWTQIVGVVGSTKNRGLDSPTSPEVFMSVARDEGMWNQLWLMVRTDSDPRPMLQSIREEIRRIDPDQPVYLAMTLNEAIAFTVLPRRTAMWLLVAFGGLAMLLATVGLYSVIAYSTTRRTQEIGVRLALGASPRDVRNMVVGSGIRLAAIGILAGGTAAVLIARLAAALLHGISAFDPAVYGLTAGALISTAALASYVPARRATRIDPSSALRDC